MLKAGAPVFLAGVSGRAFEFFRSKPKAYGQRFINTYTLLLYWRAKLFT